MVAQDRVAGDSGAGRCDGLRAGGRRFPHRADRRGDQQVRRIYRTTDGASSWSLVHAGPLRSQACTSFTPLIGYVVGSARTVLSTADGGLTWTVRPHPGAFGPTGIRCGTPLACLITTAGPSMLRTTDGGATWSSVTASTQKILAAAFTSPTQAVAAGEGGATVLSDDTGATWSPVGKRLSATFQRVRALSSSVVFATGPAGALARSDDGGVTWTEVGVSTSEDVIDVSFVDEATGYALDAAGTLLRTENSGQSWQILNTGTASPHRPSSRSARRSSCSPVPRECCARPTEETPSSASAAAC